MPYLIVDGPIRDGAGPASGTVLFNYEAEFLDDLGQLVTPTPQVVNVVDGKFENSTTGEPFAVFHSETLTARFVWIDRLLTGGRLEYTRQRVGVVAGPSSGTPGHVSYADIVWLDEVPADSPLPAWAQGVDAKIAAAAEAATAAEAARDDTIAALDTKIDVVARGALSGVAPIDGQGHVVDGVGQIQVARPVLDVATLVVTKERYPSLDPTGVFDSTPAINQAIKDAPEGASVVLVPGRYRCDTAIENRRQGWESMDSTAFNYRPNKSIRLVGYGATLIKNASAALIQFRGGWDAILPVSSIASIQIQTESLKPTDDLLAGVEVTFDPAIPASSYPWQRGDLVKIFAEDGLPGARRNETNPTEASTVDPDDPDGGVIIAEKYSRVGQFLTVYEVLGNKAKLFGRLYDPHTRGIRIARMQRVSTDIAGFQMDTPQSIIDDKTKSSSMMFHNSVYMPSVRDVKILKGNGGGVQVRSCYAYTVDNVAVGFLMNSPGTNAATGKIGQYGYGVIDNNSAYGTIIGLRGHELRHVYTDGGESIVEGVGIERYGRSYGNRIIAGAGVSGTSGAWNTHHESLNISFLDCVVLGGRGGFGVRGRHHTVRGGLVRDIQGSAFDFYMDNNASESYGHLVDGVKVENAHRVLATNLYSGQAMSYVSNIHATGITQAAMVLDRGNVRVDNMYVRFASSVDNTRDTGLIELGRAAHIEGSNITLDLRNSTLSSPTRVIDAGIATDNGTPYVQTVHLDGLRVQGTAGQIKTIMRNMANTTRRIDLLMSHVPTTSYFSDDGVAGGWIDYDIETSVTTSSRSRVTGAFLTSPPQLAFIGRTRRDATLEVDPAGADYLLTTLPPGFRYGQRLTIVNVGTGTVTVRNGAIGGAILASDKVIGPGQALLLELSLTGTVVRWRHVAALT